ncbi:MAG: acylphosphatase [Myxococcota bacterium]|nr:acylphosphatase [Myxococcota bacterium]
MKLRTAHVQIKGRVQGVYFRESTRQVATALGLSGYVRNLPDGRVEALFKGEEKAVQKALEFVAIGPPHARVDQVSPCDTLQHEDKRAEGDFVVLVTPSALEP